VKDFKFITMNRPGWVTGSIPNPSTARQYKLFFLDEANRLYLGSSADAAFQLLEQNVKLFTLNGVNNYTVYKNDKSLVSLYGPSTYNVWPNQSVTSFEQW
jgi:hypothetical protein